MSIYDDADAALDASNDPSTDPSDSGPEVCECGQVHDVTNGLGAEFLAKIEAYGGYTDPTVQGALTQIAKREFGVEVDVTSLTPDEVGGLVFEMAFPGIRTANWTEARQSASDYLAREILRVTLDLANLVSVLRAEPDVYALHPANGSDIVTVLDEIGSAVSAVVAVPVNPLTTEALLLEEMDQKVIEIPTTVLTTSTAADIDAGSFGEQFHAALAKRQERTSAVGGKLQDLLEDYIAQTGERPSAEVQDAMIERAVASNDSADITA